jgi:hypothetical protein
MSNEQSTAYRRIVPPLCVAQVVYLSIPVQMETTRHVPEPVHSADPPVLPTLVLQDSTAGTHSPDSSRKAYHHHPSSPQSS